jgi:hypothetical protein
MPVPRLSQSSERATRDACLSCGDASRESFINLLYYERNGKAKKAETIESMAGKLTAGETDWRWVLVLRG